ncbi:hypothetical protein F4819DRAFT_506705 [Hypoxylon fuscum]|nr:hypothetical protein F4819DRAFT_506705 [Hypoxylon fuscum]
MEPPSKRMKLGQAPYDDNDDDDEANLDELTMDPIQFDARQDPLYQLDRGRAKAATRLKSAFERIFEKYGRDFTGVGDEIDLETGEVIINNGHLQSLEDEEDRSREGSTSDNEEEMITKGKENGPVTKSDSKASAQSNSSTHNCSPGLHAGPSRSGSFDGNGHHSSLGMPPSPYDSPNPFMPGLPMFGNRPSDPLWQAPEIPVPLYQDRYDFMRQAMGYSPSLGYGYGPTLAPGGGYGPQRLPHAKIPKRKSLARTTAAEDDTEGDDILLGDTMQKVGKTTNPKSKSTPSQTARKEVQTDQANVRQTVMTTTRNTPDKPRRGPGRPKKAISPAKSSEPSETIEHSNGSPETISNTPTQESAMEPTPLSIATPRSQTPPLSDEESILVKRIAAELIQNSDIPTPGDTDTDSSDSQHRRSSRNRRQTEFYGKIAWLKTRRPRSEARSETSDVPNATEKLVDGVLDSSHTASGTPNEHARSDEPSDEEDEVIQPKSCNQPKEDNADELAEEPEIDAHNQENHSEQPPTLDQVESDGDAIFEDLSNEHPLQQDRADSYSTDVFFTAENSREPDPLFADSETATKETENPLAENKTSSDNEPPPSSNPLKHPDQNNQSDQTNYQNFSPTRNTVEVTEATAEAEISTPDLLGNKILEDLIATPDSPIMADKSQEPLQPPKDSAQNTPNHSDNQAATPERNTAEDMVIVADMEVTSQDPSDDELLGPSEKAQKPSHATDEIQEKTPSPPVLKEPSKADVQSPNPQLGENQFLETRPVEPEVHVHDDVDQMPDPIRAPAKARAGRPKKQVPAQKSELALRPSAVPTDPTSGECELSQGSSHTHPKPSPNNRPSPKPSTQSPAPSTPKKPKDSSVAALPKSGGSHRTSSVRRKFALASLIPDDPDDEDELSVLSSSVTSSPFRSLSLSRPEHYRSNSSRRLSPAPAPASTTSTPRKTGRRHGVLVGSSTPAHRVAKHAPPATDSRAAKRRFHHSSAGLRAAPHSSPLARTVVGADMAHSDVFGGTPSRRAEKRDRGPVRFAPRDGGSSPVRTPGGEARRCGEDGFVCERDFCFTCCK